MRLEAETLDGLLDSGRASAKGLHLGQELVEQKA